MFIERLFDWLGWHLHKRPGKHPPLPPTYIHNTNPCTMSKKSTIHRPNSVGQQTLVAAPQVKFPCMSFRRHKKRPTPETHQVPKCSPSTRDRGHQPQPAPPSRATRELGVQTERGRNPPHPLVEHPLKPRPRTKSRVRLTHKKRVCPSERFRQPPVQP